MGEYQLSETARQDQELLLLILIPVIIVVLLVVILEGQNELCGSIAMTSWVLVSYSFCKFIWTLFKF